MWSRNVLESAIANQYMNCHPVSFIVVFSILAIATSSFLLHFPLLIFDRPLAIGIAQSALCVPCYQGRGQVLAWCCMRRCHGGTAWHGIVQHNRELDGEAAVPTVLIPCQALPLPLCLSPWQPVYAHHRSAAG